jgi:hypothetical protein
VLVAGALSVTSQASAADPAVWIGSPIDGRWTDSTNCRGAKFGSSLCSLPSVHHIAYLGSKAWATDLEVGSGAGVYLYAAPKSTSLNSRIATKVESVKSACSSGSAGYRVIVWIYLDKTRRTGQMAYAHINPVSGLSGKWVSRWGAKLGTVGSYSKSSCWTGIHLHIEMASTSGYACYNKGWKASSVPIEVLSDEADELHRLHRRGLCGSAENLSMIVAAQIPTRLGNRPRPLAERSRRQ